MIRWNDDSGHGDGDGARGAVDAQPQFGVLSLPCAEPRRVASELSCIQHAVLSNVFALTLVVRINSEGVFHMELSDPMSARLKVLRGWR